MTNDATLAAEVLAEHRASIDRLDAILVYTLAERFKQTKAVGRLKAEHSLPPSDPAREMQQIERLEWLSQEADLDPEFAKKFLVFIIQEVIQHHYQQQLK
ncbi:MAG: chorismate mutase [Boseongicola sp.]